MDNKVKTNSEYQKRLESLRQLTGVAFDSAHSDEYLRGMYNGMEFALSIFEGREPKYVESTRTRPKMKGEHSGCNYLAQGLCNKCGKFVEAE